MFNFFFFCPPHSLVSHRGCDHGNLLDQASPIHHFMNGARAGWFNDEELWVRERPAFLRLISGQLAGNWRIVCLGVIVLAPSHISSPVDLVSRPLISAVCLCDKRYPIVIKIDCWGQPDEKKTLQRLGGPHLIYSAGIRLDCLRKPKILAILTS